MGETRPTEMLMVDDWMSPEDMDFIEEYARKLDYSGEVNPADGVEYPHINSKVPTALRKKIEHDTHMEIATTFFRLTCESTDGAPHQAHTDSIMGDYTMLVYLQDGEGGTSLVEHKETGMRQDPETMELLDTWRRDTNIQEAWDIYQMFSMKRNRLVMYPSRLMHRAEPVGGFGKDVSDGRIVLVTFLNKP